MQNIFITGGSTGIGWELAKQYTNMGNRVGICGRSISKLPRDFSKDYPTISFYEVDVCDKECLHKAVNNFIEKCDGHLDIMIANAGRSTGSKQQIPDFDVVKEIIDTNLHGVLNAFSVAIKQFLQQGSGHLVAIASVAGLVGLPGAAAYSSSKAAVLNLGESLAIDLPKYNIAVTTIAPGFIDTPLTEKNDHKMPFMLPVDKAATKIRKAITKQKALYIFPWQMYLFIGLARLLPRGLYRRVMQLKSLNYSRGL